MKTDKLKKPKDQINYGFGVSEIDRMKSPFGGVVIFEMHDNATGETVVFEKKNA